MNVIVQTKPLLEALSRVGIASQHGKFGLPVLGSVRLLADGKLLTLSCTNLDLYITDRVECEVKKTGGAVVSHSMLSSFISRASSHTVSLRLVENVLIVKHGESVGNFEALPLEEYPSDLNIDEGESAQWVKCWAPDLVIPLNKIKHAISHDTSRYALLGINFHGLTEGSELAACDSHRIAVCKSTLPWPGEDVIVPEMAISAIIKLIPAVEVRIKHNRQILVLKTEMLDLATRLIDAKFPAYRKAIPEPSDRALAAIREELIEAISTAGIFLKGEEIGIRIKVKGKEISVECLDRFNTKLMATEFFKQDSIDMRFNHHYLLDALRVCENESARIEFPDDNFKSGVFREGNFVEVVMPLLMQPSQ